MPKHCDEMPFYPTCQEHAANGDKPNKKGNPNDGVHDGCGIEPDKLHRDADYSGYRRDAPKSPADLPLAQRGNDQSQPCHRETYLAGKPSEIGCRFGGGVYDAEVGIIRAKDRCRQCDGACARKGRE